MRSCLIADDHALFRRALVGLIGGRWPDAEIQEAVDFPAAWKAAASLQSPFLAVLDLDMPGPIPRADVAGLQAAAPAANIVIFTGMFDDRLLRDLIATGIVGFAYKNASRKALTTAFELVGAGRAISAATRGRAASRRRYHSHRSITAAERSPQSGCPRALEQRDSYTTRHIARNR